jgi:hypothetical protein
MLNVVMLNVSNDAFMLNIVMLSVVAPRLLFHLIFVKKT